MKVYLCSDFASLIEKSGVGRAQVHQEMSLASAGIEYTLNPHDHYDLIQVNTVFPQSVCQAIASGVLNKPVIYFAHSTQEDFRDSFIGSNALSPLFKQWLKFAYSRSDLILTPTDYSKGLLEDYGFKQPIQVMSNGIDIDYWQADDEEVQAFRHQLGVRDHEKMIVSVGLPIARKGIDDFVQLAHSFPDYKFFWFGELNRRLLPSDIKELIDQAPSNLYFPGYVPREEIRLVYQACDLYLFLTREETEGIVLLEALASRAPTLVRAIPVFKKYQDGYDLYKGRNLRDFKAMLPLILDGKFEDLTENGYQKAKEYSVEANGKKYAQLYTELLAEKNSMENTRLGQKLKKARRISFLKG